MEEYIVKLREKVKSRKMGFFWLMPNRKDFKPIIFSEKEMTQRITDNLSKYAGKQIANVRCILAPDPKRAIARDECLVRFSVTVYTIREDGHMKMTNRSTGVTVEYYEDDLNDRKFAFKDMERFVKLCAEGHISSDAIQGRTFKQHIDALKKKRIIFDYIYL